MRKNIYFKMKILLGLVFIFLVLPLGNSQLILKQNSIADLKIPCTYDGSFCLSSAVCNITIVYPNGSIMINNKLMTNTGNGMPNITLTDSSVFGEYKANVFCCQSGLCESATIPFKITGTGEELTTGTGILIIIALFGAIVLMFITLFGAVKIPYKNPRNPDGMIIGINSLKYAKLLLIAISYILGIWIFFLLYQFTRGYLSLESVGTFFYFIYMVLIGLFTPVLFIGIFILAMNFITDKKIQNSISRGLDPSRIK